MKKPGEVTYNCRSPSSWEMGSRRMRSQPMLHTEFEASLGYRKTCLKKQSKHGGDSSRVKELAAQGESLRNSHKCMTALKPETEIPEQVHQ